MTTNEETPETLPVIPDVTLLGEIARGGMGIVYRGRQDFLDRDVAVKLLSPELCGERFTARFRREARILAGIKHPNIVGCHLAGTTSAGQSYLVMEFVGGPSLESWIAERGPLATAAALRLTRQLASALSHAAEQGVIHRDVKPENILLEAPTSTSIDLAFPWVPKLVDLGLARLTGHTGDLALTAPGAVMGTPATMAPEQFDDPESVDFRADIYGLGCVLYQMLTAEPAFESTQLTDIVVEKRKPAAPDPCDRRTDIPPAVGRLVARMLASDRDLRPAGYRELIARLDELAAELARGSLPAASTSTESGEGSQKNLLQTAEFDFLAAGGGIGGDDQPRAFPDPTGIGPRVAPPAATAAPATAAQPPRRRGPRRLVAGVIVIAFLLAAAVGVKRVRRNLARHPHTPPAPTAAGDSWRHGAAIRGLDGAIRPDTDIGLRAEHPVAERGGLRYRWTVHPEDAARLEAPASPETVLDLEGLPGDEFTVALEIGDGRSEPVRIVRRVELDYEPVDLFADFLADDSAWSSPGRFRGGNWTRGADDGAVSCSATFAPAVRARGLVGRVWRVNGQLRPERTGRRTFAQTAVFLRLDDSSSLAVLCERQGSAGEQWSISLQEVDREDRRAGFSYRPLDGQPKAVMFVDKRSVLEGASYSITRRGDEVVFEIGFPESGEVVEHRTRIRRNVENAMLILYARGGRGVYPKLELW